ncbi:MAG: DNA repair protein RadC [Flavobacteriia bacterium]|nr:DNA repair protein RadC [Flavobacteriia bacterium]
MKEKDHPISSLQLDDRPRERMAQLGRTVLSDAEILAILIGSGLKHKSALGLAREILISAGGLRSLARWTLDDYTAVDGIGQAKAVRLMSAFELGRRFPLDNQRASLHVKSSSDAYDLFQPVLSDLRHEEFWVIYLSNANRVLAREKLSQGGMTGTVTDLRLLFRKALSVHATGVILAHNHPSGNLQPSAADHNLTRKTVEAGRIMDITILDHLILSPTDYVSFADEGWLTTS